MTCAHSHLFSQGGGLFAPPPRARPAPPARTAWTALITTPSAPTSASTLTTTPTTSTWCGKGTPAGTHGTIKDDSGTIKVEIGIGETTIRLQKDEEKAGPSPLEMLKSQLVMPNEIHYGMVLTRGHPQVNANRTHKTKKMNLMDMIRLMNHLMKRSEAMTRASSGLVGNWMMQYRDMIWLVRANTIVETRKAQVQLIQQGNPAEMTMSHGARGSAQVTTIVKIKTLDSINAPGDVKRKARKPKRSRGPVHRLHHDLQPLLRSCLRTDRRYRHG